MSMKLKESLVKKMDVKPSAGFDDKFFARLDKENTRPGVFASWLTWAISGCATASVLFIAVNNYNVPARHSFNHKEYVESVLEIQKTFNEDVSSDEMIDLTTTASDEI